SRVPSRSTSCPARRTVQSSPELASSRSRRRRSCSPPWWRRSWTGASSERRAFGAADGPARSRLEAAIRRGTPAARIARAVAIAASVTRIVGSEPSRGDNPSTTASVPLIAGTSSCWTAGRARTTLSVGESLGSCSGCTAVACTSSPLTKASRTTASPRGSAAPITVMLLLVMTRTYRRARPSRGFRPAHYRVSHSAGDRVRPAPCRAVAAHHLAGHPVPGAFGVHPLAAGVHRPGRADARDPAAGAAAGVLGTAGSGADHDLRNRLLPRPHPGRPADLPGRRTSRPGDHRQPAGGGQSGGVHGDLARARGGGGPRPPTDPGGTADHDGRQRPGVDAGAAGVSGHGAAAGHEGPGQDHVRRGGAARAGGLPRALRARGMALSGGVVRVGQVPGPWLGALVLALGHDTGVLVLYAVTACGATAMVATFLPAGALRGGRSAPRGRRPRPSQAG